MRYGEVFVEAIAPGMWSFTDADFPPLGIEIPNAHLAMWNVAVREVFHGEWHQLAARTIRQFMRRSIHSAQLYVDAEQSLCKYFQNFERSKPKLELYFSALNAVEMCILQAHIAVDSLKNFLPAGEADKLVADTSSLNKVASNIKHFGGQSRSSQGAHNKTFPIFFMNGGVTNGKDQLKFADLREFILMSLRLVEQVMNRQA